MKPTLYILAAGMGSRYGGLKQLDGLGPSGETIMDYSIYDALRAGFGKVVFVIRKDFEADFIEKIANKYKNHIPVEIVFQDINTLPAGFSAPADRTKPWGTNHAVLMGKDVIREPFAVINADDFYGSESYSVLAHYLTSKSHTSGEYCMIGYRVGNTLSESGTVSRGVCSVDPSGYLTGVVERTAIARVEGVIKFKDENGEMVAVADNTPVSMNMWGFTPDYFQYSEELLAAFLTDNISNLKSEWFIPTVVDTLISEKKATCQVLDTPSKWFGVTYPEDRQEVVDKLATLVKAGVYPTPLF